MKIAFQAIHAEKLKVGAIVLMADLYHRPKNHLDLIRYIKIISEYTEKVPILYHHYPKYTQLYNSKLKKFDVIFLWCWFKND